MPSAAIQRLESLLQNRKFDHTVAGGGLRHDGRFLSTGLELLDLKLGGGWPRGEVSELVGERSSGRTSLLIATLRAATRLGGLVALVDGFDRFDPATAARAGLDLDRVLWVRGPSLTLEGLAPRPATSVERAVLNAVRALDLIVRAGGFAVAALDLADVPQSAIRALPFTTWLRLAHVNEGRETVCLLISDAPMGRSARGVSLRLNSRRCWSGASRQRRRFTGFDLNPGTPEPRNPGTP
jgi:hypothetical protein